MAATQTKLSTKADAQIEVIAKKHLRLETLEERKSDSLDFHELSVWQIREALLADYEAGRNSR